MTTPDPKKVFVVHGRNTTARDGMFDFLRAIGLNPIDWSEAVRLTGKGSPYIGEILDAAFREARAVVVLMTPDEVAYLRPEYSDPHDPRDAEPGVQPRPNVLFEAGMGLGRDADRTIIVELGQVRPFSDIAGRHLIRMDGSASRRRELAERLATAGCSVTLDGDDWETKGDLTPPSPAQLEAHDDALATLDRARETRPFLETATVEADHANFGRGEGRLTLTNTGSVDLHDLRFRLPPEAGSSFFVAAEQPIAKLQVGKSVGFQTMRTMGGGASTFDLLITARMPDDTPVETTAFVSIS